MKKILVVSDNEKEHKALSSSLSEKNIAFTSEFSISAILQKLKDDNYELLIIAATKCEKLGADLALNLQKKADINILLIVNSENIAKISSKLSEFGIFVISASFKDWEIVQAINFIKSTHSRFDSLKKEKDGLVKKVEDMKIIDRAKCCLIHYLRIPEATAHRHIEKQAMDMRCTKRQVAEEILKKYES